MLKTVFLDKFDPGSPGSYLAEAIYAAERLFGVTITIHDHRALLFDADGKPTARTKKILAATPMKKFGEVSDLTGALLWLADDKASGFVTGTVIAVDGGFSAYSGV